MLSWGRGRLKKDHNNNRLTLRQETQLAPWILMHQSLTILPRHRLSSANRLAGEHKDRTAVKNTLRNVQMCWKSSPVEQTPSNKETVCEPQATFWEGRNWDCHSHNLSLPLLMANQPSTDGLEQISGTKLNVKKSLSDSKRVNYSMSFTTGRTKAVIENYHGLPNGCQLVLKVLDHWFGKSAMKVQALKSSVTDGPKIRPGDNAALLALFDNWELLLGNVWVAFMWTSSYRKLETHLWSFARSSSRKVEKDCDVVSREVRWKRAGLKGAIQVQYIHTQWSWWFKQSDWFTISDHSTIFTS